MFVVSVLVLDWYGPTAGTEGSTVWDPRVGGFDRRSTSVLSGLAHLALLWSPTGALVASLLAVVLTALAARRMVAPWLVPFAVAMGVVWQVGGYLALALQVDWLRTPRPGPGIVGALTATGLSILAMRWREPEREPLATTGGRR